MKQLHARIRTLILGFIDAFYPLFKKLMPLQTFRYAACGGFNVALDISIFTLVNNYIVHVLKQDVVQIGPFPMTPHIAALFVAFGVSFPVGFYLSRYVVWQQTATSKRVQLARYFLVVVICLLMNYALLKLFVDHFGWYPTISKVIITVVVTTFSYLSQRHFSFSERSFIRKKID
ncbi:GtrA family protein [Deminuibacter soli]|uniref:GtrA family protein n=1 Tax=Deminuibacter soli TaxID=2291815 RepID=A0A3E1NJB9_9BACT|nr:GtrA family protein [Deminuibacter soli]RFM28029.1 GtrA family protein [Deminuibacter soli]